MGNDLYRLRDGRQGLVARIAPAAAGGRWEVKFPGRLIVSFQDEATARAAVERFAEVYKRVVTELT